MTGATMKEQYETYTVKKMYAFLSGYTLSRNPGTEFEYSNVGMALLGHVIALKAGTNFESLVVNRICRPLHMDSTSIALTPELKARLAMGHDDSGKPSPPWELQAYSPAGDVHSTAKDPLDVTPKVRSGSIQVLIGFTSTEFVSSPPANAPAVRTNLAVACRVLLPNSGGLVVAGSNASYAQGTNYWLILSPTAVGARGNPIKL